MADQVRRNQDIMAAGLQVLLGVDLPVLAYQLHSSLLSLLRMTGLTNHFTGLFVPAQK